MGGERRCAGPRQRAANAEPKRGAGDSPHRRRTHPCSDRPHGGGENARRRGTENPLRKPIRFKGKQPPPARRRAAAPRFSCPKSLLRMDPPFQRGDSPRFTCRPRHRRRFPGRMALPVQGRYFLSVARTAPLPASSALNISSTRSARPISHRSLPKMTLLLRMPRICP